MTHPLIESSFTKSGPYFDTIGGANAYRYVCNKPECDFAYIVTADVDHEAIEHETNLLTHLSAQHAEPQIQGDFPQHPNLAKYIEAGSAGMQHAARQIVQHWYNGQRGDSAWLSFDEVYVVWFAKVLQNFKALVSTNVADLRYYEVTFDGDQNKFYLDVYKKEANQELNG